MIALLPWPLRLPLLCDANTFAPAYLSDTAWSFTRATSRLGNGKRSPHICKCLQASACSGYNSSDHLLSSQFYEIFHGQEGQSDVRDRFYAFLRQIDDFLQVLTLGISADKREDKTLTTASYRELPTDRISLLEGGATCKPSLSFRTIAPSSRTNFGHVVEEPLRVKLPALCLQTYSAWGLRDDEMESFLFRTDIAHWFPRDSVFSRFAGPACIRAAEDIPPNALRPFWPMTWDTKRFCDQDFHWNRA